MKTTLLMVAICSTACMHGSDSDSGKQSPVEKKQEKTEEHIEREQLLAAMRVLANRPEYNGGIPVDGPAQPAHRSYDENQYTDWQ